jgi:hypothetical protein
MAKEFVSLFQFIILKSDKVHGVTIMITFDGYPGIVLPIKKAPGAANVQAIGRCSTLPS